MNKKTTSIILAVVVIVIAIAIATRESVIASGCFHQVAHTGHGCAMLVGKSNGRVVLRLTDFATAESSDLHVMLSTASDSLENTEVQRSETLDLGPLKMAEGSQDYDVPSVGNLTDFHSVTIWNNKHQVNFTSAPLR
jgi:hypothetical protein